MSQPSLNDYYHPIPFEEYSNISAKRIDSKDRYNKIKESYGDFTGKTLIDFGCAEGFFMWRFIQDGGFKAHGIEVDETKVCFINKLALSKKLRVSADIQLSDGFSDIGIYLDLYGDSQISVSVLDALIYQCQTLFVSRSGCTGDGRDKQLKEHLERLNLKHTLIHKGFSGREIFRCDK